MEEEDKFVTYLGRPMVKGWPEKMEAAQKETHVLIDGVAHERIKYGSETRWKWKAPSCHGCAVLKGEYHVPGCDAEQCPVCGGQALGCACDVTLQH